MSSPSPLTGGELVHASCVAIGSNAVLIIGPSGSGKSDLSLRLIDRGAALVSDDYTQLVLDETKDMIIASPPATIAGRIEVRGLGVLSLPWRAHAPVALAVALTAEGDPPVERLPLAQEHHSLCGREIPLIRLNAFEASAPIKVEYALAGHDGSACFPEVGGNP